MKRLLAKLAPILIPTAIVVVAAAIALSEPDWLTERVEQIVRVQLAERTGREVRVGEVRGNLLGSVVIKGLAIAQPEGFDQGTAASADEVRVRFRGKDALRREVAPLSSITSLTVVGARIKATRDETGQVDVAEMIRPKAPPRPPTEDRLQVPVIFEDASLEYVDCALPTLEGQPVRLRLSRVRGSLDLSRRDWVHVRVHGEDPDGAFGRLEATVRVNGKRGIVLIDAGATGIDLAPWARRFVPPGEVGALAGRLDARGSIHIFRDDHGTWRTGYSLAGDVTGGAVRLRSLAGESVAFSGPVRFTGDTVSTELLKMRGPGVTGSLAGAIFGLRDQPGLNLYLIASTLHLERLRDLDLIELPTQLTSVTARLPASGSFHVAGRWPSVTVAGTVDIPALSADDPALPVPRWTLEGTRASFLVRDLARPALEARAEVDRATASLPQEGMPIALGALGAGGLRATLDWRQGAGLAAALSADRLTLAGLPQARFSGEAAVQRTHASFRLAGTAWGGRLSARGAARWSPSDDETAPAEPTVTLAGRVHGLDLSAAQHLTLVGPKADDYRQRLAQFPAGRLTGDYEAAISRSTVELGFHGDVESALYRRAGGQPDEYTDYEVPDLALAARLAASVHRAVAEEASESERTWQLDSGAVAAHVRDYGGEVWARLTYPFPMGDDAEPPQGAAAYRAQVAALGVDLASLPMAQKGGDGGEEPGTQPDAAASPDEEQPPAAADFWEGLAGTAHLLADLRLAPDEDGQLRLLPSKARVLAFDPRLGDYRLDTLAVRASGDLQRVAISEARAYVGASAAEVTGAISQIDTEEADAALDLTLSCDADEPQKGSRLEDWLHAAALASDAHGVLTASAHITGTVKKPVVQGEATLLRGGVLGYELDYARSPFAYAGDTLHLKDVHLEAYGGSAAGELTVDEVRDREKQKLAGDFRAQKVWLSRLPVRLPEALDLHGALSAQGTIGGLAIDPEIAASLRAPALRLNGQLLRELQARATYGHDLVEVRDVSLKGLAGEISVQKATYDLVSRHLKCRAHLDRVGVGTSFRLGAALAAEAGASPRGLRRAAELVHGRLTADVAVDGALQEQENGGLTVADLPASVTFDVTRLTLAGKHFPDVRGQLALEGTAIRQAQVRAVEPGVGLALAGSTDPEGHLDLTVDARDVDLAFAERWLPTRLGLDGTVAARLLLRGPWQEPVLEVQDGVVLLSGLRRTPKPPAPGPRQKVEFAASLPLTTQPVALHPEGDLYAEASMEEADLGFFPPLVDQLLASRSSADGRRATAEGSAPLLTQRLSASGNLDSRLVLTGQTAAPVLSGRLSLANGAIALSGLPWPLENIELEAAFRRDEGAPEAPNRLELRRFTARLGDMYLSAPRAYAVARSLAAEDLRTAERHFTLTVWAPMQDFGHKLKVGEIGVGIRAEAEQGQKATRVTIEPFGGKIGDGTLELAGTATIENYALASLHTNPVDITLRLKDTEPRYVPYLDGLLRTAGPQGIRIHSPGNGQPAVIEGKLLLSRAGIGVQRPESPPGPEQHLLGASPGLPAPRFNLSLDVGPRVAVKLPGLTVPLAEKVSAITLQGTPQRPELRVSVDGRKGSLALPGRTLTVRKGSVQYALLPSQRRPYKGRVILEPHSQIEGELLATVADHDITISLSGPAHSPHLVMVSKPPESQDRIFHLLFGGLPLAPEDDETITERTVAALGNAAAGQIESRLISEISEVFIGTGLIDQLAVEGVLTGTPTVEVGKFLLEDLYVQYRKVLQARKQEGLPEEFDFKMSYRVEDRYQVTFSTDEERNNRVGIEYRFDF